MAKVQLQYVVKQGAAVIGVINLGRPVSGRLAASRLREIMRGEVFTVVLDAVLMHQFVAIDPTGVKSSPRGGLCATCGQMPDASCHPR